MKDILHRFFEAYLSGDFDEAINCIISHPDVVYDGLASNEKLFHYLVNYVDACIFDTQASAYHANICLFRLLAEDREFVSRYPTALSLLKFEQQVLEQSIKEDNQSLQKALLPSSLKQYLQAERLETFLLPADIDHILLQTPKHFTGCMEMKLALFQGWVSFKNNKPLYALRCFKNDFYWIHPWFPVRYALSALIPSLNDDEVPLVFLEPVKDGLSDFLNPLENRTALFVFETKSTFLQMMQFPDVVKALSIPNHLIYILDIYPNEQFSVQDRAFLKGHAFQPMICLEGQEIIKTLPALTESLKQYLMQPDESIQRDNEIGDWLYRVGKNFVRSIQMKRLGVNRAPALVEKIVSKDYIDPHKGIPLKERDLGVEMPPFVGLKLDELGRNRVIRQKNRRDKIKLAYVVYHVADGTFHSPSRLLENLIMHGDKECFDQYLMITEKSQFFAMEYPFNFFTNTLSVDAAPNRLKMFKDNGTDVYTLANPLLYEDVAGATAELLHRLDIDIAVFFGTDIVNCMCSQMTDVPLRIVFELGLPPTYPVFDLAILSSSIQLDKEKLDKLKIKVQSLPFAVDVRASWESQPITKEQLGFPDDSRLLTTISNNLDHRLSDEMCLAIAEILKNVPEAYYAPIGYVGNQSRFKGFFKQHGVEDRVVFLGEKMHPSRYVRCMDLYLNEFPLGSGVAILDALACGCPIVSMYDVQGGTARRYGGVFFGMDRVITSCKPSDYVELACRLLSDKGMYREWSDHAKKQYEKFSDAKAYAKKFESIVLQAFCEKA